MIFHQSNDGNSWRSVREGCVDGLSHGIFILTFIYYTKDAGSAGIVCKPCSLLLIQVESLWQRKKCAGDQCYEGFCCLENEVE